MSLFWLFLLCPIGYLIGNINPAKYIARSRNKDITKLGSGNLGTMNVARQLGVKLGILCLALDMLKGAIPALVAYLMYGGDITISLDDPGVVNSYIALYAVGLSVVVGHCFPVFLKFRGGKGFASMIGVFMVAHPWISILAFAIMLAYIMIFEYGAMGSFIYITVMVVYAAMQPFNEYNMAVCALLCAFYFLTWYTHRKNIVRLLVGKENYVQIFKSLQNKRLKKRQEKWLESLAKE
jgi:glycerol-3-phosphate acyltransferase PlsY